jgi:hypothetical protein
MFADYLYFRKTVGVDDLIRQNPMPFQDVYESIAGEAHHGCDKSGRPIYIQRTGNFLRIFLEISAKNLLKLYAKNLVRISMKFL